LNDPFNNKGYFIFSLDTELAWGYYDLDRHRSSHFSSDGSRERRAIARILDLLDEFNIVATWAVVGHLFYDRCEECPNCPILAWDGRYQTFDEVYKTNHPLWYGADIVDLLLRKGSKHEIAFHGYTHQIFEESEMTKEEAQIEVDEWLRMARRKNIVPKTVVFPRNIIGYLDMFEENGFICYRGPKVMPRTYSIPILGKILNRIDLTFQIFVPQVYDIEINAGGLINIPSSQWLFRMNRRIETILDSLNLQTLRLRSITKAVEKAAEEKKIVHIWAHPFEFQTEKDFEKLRFLFHFVSEKSRDGAIQSISMKDLAIIAKEESIKNDSRRNAIEINGESPIKLQDSFRDAKHPVDHQYPL
jgi:hypothetical protein